jgi:hypothetical protein
MSSRHTAPARRRRALALVALIAPVGIACESEATAPDPVFVEGQVSLDATSATNFVYVSLESGSVVTVADPSTSTAWDIAFRRFSTKLNGGVAGPGGVAGFGLSNNADATADEVVGYTPADGEAAFDAVTEASIAGATFAEDGLVADVSGPWFRFSPQAGTLVANPGAAWKVREADGGFALFRVASLQMAGQAPLGLTVEYRHQAASGALGALGSVVVSFAQGPAHLDLASGTVVQPSGCNWDVRATPQFAIEFNAACSAGSFPMDPTEDFTAITSAGGAPAYGGFLATIAGAIPSAIDDASGIFWYNIEGNNRLWPTYNVFLVRRGEAVYKVQVTDYYNTSGASGYPTIRFKRLR